MKISIAYLAVIAIILHDAFLSVEAVEDNGNPAVFIMLLLGDPGSSFGFDTLKIKAGKVLPPVPLRCGGGGGGQVTFGLPDLKRNLRVGGGGGNDLLIGGDGDDILGRALVVGGYMYGDDQSCLDEAAGICVCNDDICGLVLVNELRDATESSWEDAAKAAIENGEIVEKEGGGHGTSILHITCS